MRRSIPWEYTNGQIKVWRWLTKHFDAQIRTDADAIRFVYVVTDLTRGRRVPLANEFAMSFEDAEHSVAELVGKSYPVGAGYRPFAGDLATTFKISTGEEVDFGPFEGSQVQLTARTRQGVKVFDGTLQIRNYDIEILDNNGATAIIPPVLVQSVTADRVQRTERLSTTPGSVNRSVRGKYTTGCTGSPGFFDDTVDHSPAAAWCPLHGV